MSGVGENQDGVISRTDVTEQGSAIAAVTATVPARRGQRIGRRVSANHGPQANAATSNATEQPSRIGKPPSNPQPATTGETDFLIDGVARLISETAHDLRSPLTTVREAVRLVSSGDLGEINQEQQEMLKAAIDQCHCLDSMVGEMVQLERLRTGMPRANRDWVALHQIRHSVDETLKPWATPREIDILWDLSANPNRCVYADVSLVRRLIVNLVVNAIRASRDGQCVLIRVTEHDSGDSVQCSVIDQGAGIKHQDMVRLSRHAGSTMAQGEGLGLSICRQLSAVHFSALDLRSRPGEGTQASFSLPAGGPSSVATAWVRWRLGLEGLKQKPYRVTSRNQILRHDKTSLASTSVRLQHQATRPRFKDLISVGTVSLGAAVSRDAAAAFETTLHNHTQMFDLVYKVDSRTWVWMFDADTQAAGTHIEMINDRLEGQDHSIRTTWSEPQEVSLEQRQTLARISDLLVRQTLSSATAAPHMALDQDEVRPGTEPIKASLEVSERLDSELRRLGRQLSEQASRLQQQAVKLRPKN